MIALATALDMENKNTATALHQIAQQVEDRLIAMAEVVPELEKCAANEKKGDSRQSLVA